MFLIPFLLAGCSTTYLLSTPDEFNRLNGAHPATIYLKSGIDVSGRDIHVGMDSIRFTGGYADSVLRLPVGEVQSIEHVDRFTGALFGFVVGSVSGGLVGVAIAPELDGHHGNHIEAGVGILGAMIGGGVGIIWGALQGTRTHYEFPSRFMRSSTQNNSEPKK